MKKLAILILVTFGLGQAFLDQPEFSKVGMSGAQFLKIPTSARVVGLGGAFTAIANDLSTLNVNPAGITNIQRRAFTATEVRWIADINYAYMGIAVPMGYNAIGIHMSALTMGKIRKTTYDDPYGDNTSDFTAHSEMLGIIFGRKMTDKLSVGIEGKVVHEAISNLSATGIALDLGTYYNTGFKSLRIGMTVHNFGTDMQFNGQDLKVSTIPSDWQEEYGYQGNPLPLLLETSSYSLPLYFRLGIAYDFVNVPKNKLTGALDLIHPNDGLEKVLVGAEYEYDRFFYLRAGYKLDPDRFYDKKSALFSLSAGFGVKFNVGPQLISLDYAFYNNGRLGLNHFFTISYAF